MPLQENAMPSIQWINEADATGAVAEGYNEYFRRRPDRTTVAPIIKCFSHRPEFMKQVMQFSWDVHFSDGHLTEKTKEMIATLVSGQNRCPYCMHSHAYFLQEEHGAGADAVACIGRGEIESAPISEAEKALLRYAKTIANESYRATAADAQALRDAGWTDPQIAEAVYTVALFSFFNRVANAFGLTDPQYFANAGIGDPLAGFLTPPPA
jgi:uncharacterized peroxidase-related enzyme